MPRKSLLTLTLIAVATISLSATAEIAPQPNLPAPNPWLADGPYAISHHTPAQTDATPIAGPSLGKVLDLDDVKTVPVTWSSAPIVKKLPTHTTIIAGTPGGILKIDGTDEAFEKVSFTDYPAKKAGMPSDKTLEKHRKRFDRQREKKKDFGLFLSAFRYLMDVGMGPDNTPSGAYGVIDHEGYYYAIFDQTKILKASDNNERFKAFEILKTGDMTLDLPPKETKNIAGFGLNILYDGHLVVAANGGLFVFDRDLNRKDYLLFPDEKVENSIAIEESAIFVATSKKMRKVVWTGDQLSTDKADGAWSQAYPTTPFKVASRNGAVSEGTGTTPSLMGFGDDEDKLVLIADGDPNGSQLTAFWRNEIPDNDQRIAGTIKIPGATTTSEASPAVLGYGVLVQNTSFPKPSAGRMAVIANAFRAGITRPAPRGLYRFNWDPEHKKFEHQWTLPEIDNTDWMPPAISTTSRRAYIATKTDHRYEYIAVDFDTGQQIARWQFPDDSILWNNWGGVTTLLEDGDLLLGGLIAVKRYDIGSLKTNSILQIKHAHRVK